MSKSLAERRARLFAEKWGEGARVEDNWSGYWAVFNLFGDCPLHLDFRPDGEVELDGRIFSGQVGPIAEEIFKLADTIRAVLEELPDEVPTC